MPTLNARFLCQPFTGVQRYALELAQRISFSPVLAPRGASQSPLAKEFPRLRESKGPWTGHVWEQSALPLSLGKSDLLFSPAGAGPVAHARQVITVHDVAQIERPEYYDPKFALWYRCLYPLLLPRVSAILTPSHYSKERLLALYRLPESKIHVTPEAADSKFQRMAPDLVATILAELKVSGPYVLVVGAISERKNLKRLFMAWSKIKPKLPDHKIVFVGKFNLAFARDTGSELDLNEIQTFSGITDTELIALYNGAAAFAYPSLYEGFGLPIVEAMACGAPVLSANVTSIPEVAGQAAVLIDPLNVDDMADGLLSILENESKQESLRIAGLEQSRRFSWDRCAEQSQMVLQALA